MNTTNAEGYINWLAAASPVSAECITAHVGAGGKLFVTEARRVITVKPGSLPSASWGSSLPARQHAEKVDADRSSVGSCPVGGTVEVRYTFHPRHGWKTMKMTRFA